MDGLWLAVPKKKVSRHRRGMRNAGKGLRRVPVVAQCSVCKKVMQQHVVPKKCAREDCPCKLVAASS